MNFKQKIRNQTQIFQTSRAKDQNKFKSYSGECDKVS